MNFSNDPRRLKACQRLGDEHPECSVCGEADPLDLELHHVAGRAYDDMTVILCHKCHRKVSNPADNLPAEPNPTLTQQVGHFLIGLAELLQLLAERLLEFGRSLLALTPGVS
jgi:hypothetical protein